MKKQPLPLDQALRQAIEDSEHSWNRIAVLAGITLPMVSRFVKKEREISLATASKIAQVLNLKLVPANE